MVKRELKGTKDLPFGSPYSVPSYFYPVSSAIYTEDLHQTEQMAIMNDRPQGGSAYSPGRIELMINRYGLSSDQLGVLESMKETDFSGKGLNVSGKFILVFT
jgi:hypothetical protein